MANFIRGISSAGGEFATDAAHLPGTYDTDYHYDSQSSLNYLASRGHKAIRLAIRWERIQPTRNSALNSTELARIISVVANIEAAGMKAILDVHNYAEFIQSTGDGGATLRIGNDLPSADLIDLWTRLSTAFNGNNGIYAYGLMNEPHDIPPNIGTFSGNVRYDWNDATVQGWTGDSATATNVSSKLRLAATATNGYFNFRKDDAGTLRGSGSGSVLQMKVTLAAGAAGAWRIKPQWQNASWSWINADTVSYKRVDTGATVSGLIAGVEVLVTAIYTTNPIDSGLKAFCVQIESDNATAGAISADIDDFSQGTLSGSQTGAEVWESTTQSLVDAIRANGDNTLLMIPGHSYSGAQVWTTNHPDAWITDSANNFKYEAHYYADIGNSGAYNDTYATTNTDAVAHGYANLAARVTAELSVWLNWLTTNSVKGFLGEFGWRNDESQSSWNAIGEVIYDLLDTAEVDATYWATGEWWGTSYKLSAYTGTPLNTATSAATIIEAHLIGIEFINIKGLARITAAALKTLLGRASIAVTTLKTVLGISRIQTTSIATVLPSTISGLALWLKADSLSLNDGDTITTWADQSGNGYNAAGSGTVKPTYITSVVNGLPIVRLSGANGFQLGTGAAESAFDLATYSIFLIGKRTAGGDFIAKNALNGDNTRRKLQISANSTQISITSGADGVPVISATAPTSKFNVYGIIGRGNSDHDIIVNGVVTHSTSTIYDDQFNNNRLEIGQAFSNGAERITGDIAEILIFNRNLTTEEVNKVLKYLNVKWAINSSVIAGKGSIAITTLKTILGLARLTAFTLKTIQGLARLTSLALKTIQGKARITIVTLQTILGKARITASTLKTILGKSRITISTLKTIQGLSRITASTLRTILGLSRITASTLKTIIGKSRTQIVSSSTGYALQFDGIQNYVSLGTLGTLGADSSAGLYVKFDIKTITTAQSGLGEYNASTESLYIYLNANSAQANVSHDICVIFEGNNNTFYIGGMNSPTINFNDGQKHTIEITVHPGSSIAIKIDGVTQTVTIARNDGGYTYGNFARNFLIGCVNGNGTPSGFSNAIIDNFSIGTSSSSIYASYAMNEGSDITIADSSGHGNTGTLTKGAGAYPAWVQGLLEMTGKGSIAITQLKTVLGKARVMISTLKSIQGLSRITILTLKTIAGKARITAITLKTILGKARITASTLRTAQGISRITISTIKSISGKARITASTLQNILGKARITIITIKTILGRSRITTSVLKTTLGLSRITKSTLQTLTGKARVTASTLRNISGRSLMTAITIQSIVARSRIQTVVSNITTGLSRITVSTLKTLLGKGAINAITNRNITGRARIKPAFGLDRPNSQKFTWGGKLYNKLRSLPYTKR